MKFASFIGSGTHQNYGELVVDSSGTTALQDMTNHFRDPIAKAVAKIGRTSNGGWFDAGR